MINLNKELDELFSSSKEEGQKNINTPSIIISTQASPNLESDQDEIAEQMINHAEMDLEVKINLKEQYIQSVERELISSEFEIEQTCVKDETKELNVTVEYNVIQEDCSSEQDPSSSEVLLPEKSVNDLELDLFMDGMDFKSDHYKKIESDRLKSLKEKEDKEKRYYVEKVEPRTDFSEYGEWAYIYEEEHKQKIHQNKLDNERVKKLKAEDKQKEKIQKEIQRDKLAKERSDKKIDRTINKLQVQLEKHGHYAKVIGYNDSQKIIKVAIPRTYHRLLNESGRTIVTSPFIELSNTRPAFYFYSLKKQKFVLYGESSVTKKFELMFESSTQEQMWDAIKSTDPVDLFGFTFHKYELFDSARFY